MFDWNSKQYTKFERERTQPSADLISRIQIEPSTILDIGFGPGNSTNKLHERFEEAEILGIDSSDDMLQRARQSYPHIRFEKCLVPEGLSKYDSFDLIFSNACIHWIPDHKRLIKAVLKKLNAGGRFAVQIPLVQEAPFYKLLYGLIKNEKWKRLGEIKNFHNLTPEEYYDLFSSLDVGFEMWQTSYYHIMDNYEGIIEWYKGSGLKPYLDALSENKQKELITELIAGLKKEYKEQTDKKIILKMPRLFFVLYK